MNWGERCTWCLPIYSDTDIIWLPKWYIMVYKCCSLTADELSANDPLVLVHTCAFVYTINTGCHRNKLCIWLQTEFIGLTNLKSSKYQWMFKKTVYQCTRLNHQTLMVQVRSGHQMNHRHGASDKMQCERNTIMNLWDDIMGKWKPLWMDGHNQQ